MDDLRQRINIILNEEKRAYQANDRRRGGLGSFNIKVRNGWTTVGEIPKLIVDNASLELIHSPNSTILLKLYSSLNTEGKEQLKTLLLSYLSKDSPYFDIAYLILFVLHRAGETIKAIEQARLYLKGDSDYGFSNMLAMLSKIITHEHSYISNDLYRQIKEAMQGDTEYNFKLFEKINSAELKLIEKELADINPEINKDKERVINLWKERFGSPEIPSVVDEIEEYFSTGDFTSTKFATCIGRVRVLLVEVLRNVAVKISQKDHDNKINSKTDEYAVFDYLRTKIFINDSEWQLIRALYGMASDEGAHTVIALKEYARIVKNMSIEVVLIVLSRYDQNR